VTFHCVFALQPWSLPPKVSLELIETAYHDCLSLVREAEMRYLRLGSHAVAESAGHSRRSEGGGEDTHAVLSTSDDWGRETRGPWPDCSRSATDSCLCTSSRRLDRNRQYGGRKPRARPDQSPRQKSHPTAHWFFDSSLKTRRWDGPSGMAWRGGVWE
jgi:hypothetical protein